jgi:hypothetical protein
LDDKVFKGIYIGYSSRAKAYRILDVSKKTIYNRRDVIFDENKFYKDTLKDSVQSTSKIEIKYEDILMNSSNNNQDTDVNHPLHDMERDLQQEAHDLGVDDVVTNHEESRYPKGNRSTVDPGFYLRHSVALVTEDEPATFEEAITLPHWRASIMQELGSLIRNKTFTEVEEIPEGKKSIQHKWVFRVKRDETGKILKYKSRLVCKGFQQRYGVDYQETFSPVISITTIRILLALIAHFDLHTAQMDVETAFLEAGLEGEDIYMDMPDGYEQLLHNPEMKPDNRNMFSISTGLKFVKLNKCLYGTKQAPRYWNSTIDKFFKEFGLQATKCDPCLYYYVQRKIIFLVGLYVDDLIIAGNCLKTIMKLKQGLSDRFHMKDLGELSYLLGMEIKRERSKKLLFVNQHRYITEILEKFGMMSSNSTAIPMEKGIQLVKHNLKNAETVNPYRELIGSLMYCSTHTRPDITFSTCHLSRYMSHPSDIHWTHAKRILRYLKGTTNTGLCFDGSLPLKLVGYCDADWGSHKEDRKSIIGYVYLICGVAISWKSKVHSSVALSTCEAEYVAISEAVKELLWIKQLFQELGIQIEIPLLFTDNQSAQFTATNEALSQRTKHIDIRHHFIKDYIQKRAFVLEHIPTGLNIADGMTKALCKQTFEKNLTGLGVRGSVEKYTKSY